MNDNFVRRKSERAALVDELREILRCPNGVKEELLSELLTKHGFRRELASYQQIANAVESNRGEDQLRCNAFWDHCFDQT